MGGYTIPINFKYKRIERSRNPTGTYYVYSPSIPITIVEGRDSFDVIALVDSGADHCVLPYDLADLIGLDLSAPPEETGGIGGSVESIPTYMNFVVKGPHERYNINTKVWAISGGHSDVPPILGRDNFFEHFEVTFKQKQKKIVLKKNKVKS